MAVRDGGPEKVGVAGKPGEKAMSNLYQRNGIWWARFKERGIEYRFSLRTRSEAAAKKRLKAERERIQDKAHFGIAGPVSWKSAVVSWDEHIRQVWPISETTFDRYKTSLEQVRRWLDDMELHDIDAAALRNMVKERRRQTGSNATVRRDLTAISSVLAYAVDEGLIDDNAARAYNRKRLPERRDPIILPTEEAIALTVGPKASRFGDMMMLARETGMRQEEIAGLEHASIDIKARVITFVGKRRKLRAIPLSRKALTIVSRQPRHIKCPFVFWHMDEDAEGLPIATRFRNVASNFADYTIRAEKRAAKAGKPYRRFRFHDLRHLFAVDYLRTGKGGIYDLQRILGHTSIKTTEVYLDYLTPDQAKAALIGVAQKAAHKQRS